MYSIFRIKIRVKFVSSKYNNKNSCIIVMSLMFSSMTKECKRKTSGNNKWSERRWCSCSQLRIWKTWFYNNFWADLKPVQSHTQRKPDCDKWLCSCCRKAHFPLQVSDSTNFFSNHFFNLKCLIKLQNPFKKKIQ